MPAGTAGANSDMNSALNLVTAKAASLANPYPNPTSMAGAVASKTKDKLPHPFAKSVATSVIVQQQEGVEDQQNRGAISGQSRSQFSEVPNTGPVEEQARRWFLQGVGFERHGDLYERYMATLIFENITYY